MQIMEKKHRQKKRKRHKANSRKMVKLEGNLKQPSLNIIRSTFCRLFVLLLEVRGILSQIHDLRIQISNSLIQKKNRDFFYQCNQFILIFNLLEGFNLTNWISIVTVKLPQIKCGTHKLPVMVCNNFELLRTFFA